MDEKSWQRTFEQVMSLWVNPEIRRRKERGILPKEFSLDRAQIIFVAGKRSPEIRLNEETRIVARVRLKNDEAIQKMQKGDLVYLDNIETVEEIRLPKAERDAAHISLFRSGGHWVMGFDARYNKAKAARHIKVASEFIKAADLAMQKKLWHPFVDLAFSAAELLAKGELMLMPDPKINSHKSIQIKYSKYVKIGNAPLDFKDALNKLSGLRPSGRYVQSQLSVTEEDAKRYFRLLQKMKMHVEKRLR